MRLECLGKWRYLKGSSPCIVEWRLANRFTSLPCSLPACRCSQTKPSLVGVTWFYKPLMATRASSTARLCSVFVTNTWVLRTIKLPQVLSGNTSFIFSSKGKSAVSTDRCLLARWQSPLWICSGTVCKTDLLWVANLGP